MPTPGITPENCARLQTVSRLELGWTTQLAWSPRIAQLAASSAQGMFVHNFSNEGIVRSQLPGTDELWRSVAYADDGFWVAGGADEGVVLRWRVQPGAALERVQHPVGAAHGSADVGQVHFLADGTLLVAAGPHILAYPSPETTTPITLTTDDDDKTAITSHTHAERTIIAATGWAGHIYLWADGALDGMPQRWERHTDRVNSLAFSPDGRQLASVGRDGAIILWAVETGTVRVQRNGHAPYPVDSVEFSPDGRLLATGGRDNVCRLWDAETLSPLASLEAHTKPVITLAWRPDGRMLATGSGDHHIRLWQVV